MKTFSIKTPFIRAGCRLAEGPLYDIRNNTLAWVDIIGRKVHWINYEKDETELINSHKSFNVKSPIGVLGLTKIPGIYVCAFADGIAKIDLRNAKNDDQLHLDIITTIQHDIKGMRFNDGMVDPNGGFYASSMANFDQELNDKGVLYHFIKDQQPRSILKGTPIGNGIGFSPDKMIFYFVDSANHVIWKFPYENGEPLIDQKQVFVKIDGYSVDSPEPDGMCISEDGDIWVAVWSTSTLRRYSPDGIVKEQYELPAERVSCVAFAGPEMNDLIITTASLKLDDPEGPYQSEKDQGGNLFRIKVDVRGIPRFISDF